MAQALRPGLFGFRHLGPGGRRTSPLFANMLEGGRLDLGPGLAGSGSVFLGPEFAFGHLRSFHPDPTRLLQRGEAMISVKLFEPECKVVQRHGPEGRV